MTKALTKRRTGLKNTIRRNPPDIVTKDVLMIAAAAGIVSALLPSVPTIVRYWEDETEVSVFGQKMPYSTFLKWWVGLSVVGLGYLLVRFGRK